MNHLTLVVEQAIVHTPVWVWALLLFITLIGVRQMRGQVFTSGRVIGVSFGWTAFSILSAGSSFGFNATTLATWAAGLALSLAVQRALVKPRGVRALDDGRFAVAGSVGPLLTIWLVFGVRYVSSVMLVLDPSLRHDASFGLVVPAAYGALSGLFVGRALRVLGTRAPRGTPLATA